MTLTRGRAALHRAQASAQPAASLLTLLLSVLLLASLAGCAGLREAFTPPPGARSDAAGAAGTPAVVPGAALGSSPGVTAGSLEGGAPAALVPSAARRTDAASASAPVGAASAAGGAASAASTGTDPATATLGVRIEIDAPDPLKALLQRNLDVVRLGAAQRDDVDDTEWSRLIDATPAQVRDLLQTEGYFLPQVGLERAPGRAAGQPDLVRLKIDPGPRAHISRVTIEVEGDLERGSSVQDPYATATLAALRNEWGLKGGAVFRNSAWAAAKNAALARLRSAGYANAAWSGTGAEVDPISNEVRLFAVADSGPLFRYGELDIEGLVVQDAQTVANLLDAQRGAPVSETLLLDYQERLQKSGLFENISVTLDTDPANAEKARILTRLREAPLQVYTFGVGISANTGPRASVEHFYRRVFGYAVSSRNKFEYGAERQYWEGEVSTHPGENLYRNLVAGVIKNEESSSDTVLSQRIRVGRAQDKERQERLYFIEAERSRRVPVGGEPTSAQALSLNHHSVWRQLDSVVLPTQGFTLAAEVGVGTSRGTNAEAGIFERVYGRLTGYLPFGNAFYGQGRLEVGNVFLRSNMVVPESQQFRAGGDDSVRGYAYRSLGPVVDGAVGSGTSMVTVSLEVARPILPTLPSVWGAVFVDAGNVANRLAEVKPVVGVGAGVRWRSPVGPLRLDYAYGVDVKKFRLHFSVGIAF